MIVLGINEEHQATCAILVDGEVIFSQSEERISRVKNDIGYPYESIEEALKETGISKNQIDFVVHSTLYQSPIYMKIKRTVKYKTDDWIREMHEYWKPVLLENKTSNFFKKILKDPRFIDKKHEYYNYSFMEKLPISKWDEAFQKERVDILRRHLGIDADKIFFKNHHLSHASYAYYASPIDKRGRVAVVTADGWGDDANGTIWLGENWKMKKIHSTGMCNFAKVYRFMTLLLGMRPCDHEYKVMGLAPYAKDYLLEPAYEIFKKTLVVDGLDFKWKPPDMYFYFREKLEGMRFDGIAGGLQKWVDESMKLWFSNILKRLDTDTVVFSGGLALNIKANKVISEIKGVREFFVPPSGADESTTMGAAYSFFADYGIRPKPLSHAYLGYKITEKEVGALIKKYNLREKYRIVENPTPSKIARLLASGKILARCAGRMEFGARALGNRSILADPSKLEIVAAINQKIKYRDFWMPFTPTILDSRAGDYLINPKRLTAPYMTVAFDTTARGKKDLVAATHPGDTSARPQILKRSANPQYYDLIRAFEKVTGIGALLNTSFNLHGEPIVRNAEDAYHTFINSGLDGIIFEKKLILKKESSSRES